MSIIITDAARDQIQALQKSGKMPHAVFRVQVKAGGCSGFEYIFQLDSDAASDDISIDLNNAKCVIDSASALLIEGSVLDYEMDLSGEKFVMKNPNATARCGCGNSFAL